MSNRVLLVRIATDEVARFCSGVSPVRIPADDIETVDDAYYYGGGLLADIPDIDQLINAIASRNTYALSGVSAKTLAVFQEEMAQLEGARVDVGVAYQDAQLQITSVEWAGQLFTGSPSIDDKPGQNGGRTRSISLSLGTDFTDRSTAKISFFTHSDQQRRSPGDMIFDHIAGINAGTSRSFGPKS